VSYSVKIKASAAKQLARVDVGTRRALIEQIDRLATEPYVGTALKGELDGLRRVRVGAYRIVFEVRNHELLVLVVCVGHRGSMYRR
jgi:mRNA interferase RelE/StbE